MPQTVHHLQPTPDRFEQIAYHVGRLRELDADLTQFPACVVADLAWRSARATPPTQFG